ncbi:hypothetical protein [Streptococcus suis]|uniref:hypothetical protein n=1 Tax=Streptococcus suis TaxID=1307 RepID=UPI000CF3AD46|nr:hypothetical protein [Streptococcus suis]
MTIVTKAIKSEVSHFEKSGIFILQSYFYKYYTKKLGNKLTSSAIYRKENDMRPKRYPYSGKLKASTMDIVKAWEKDCSEILQKQITSIEEKLALLYNE